MEPVHSADELIEFLAGCAGVFDSLGPEGDPVDILDHGLQCAAELATVAPDDEALQIAGLVHDLGHAVDGWHAVDHGEVGGRFVGLLLGPRVARIVALHVPAKRYLVATDPDYGGVLSSGSMRSLELQGGGMNTAEVATFELDPFAADAARLRRADEAAKVVGRRVPGLDHWAPVLARVAAAAAGTAR
jgi:predicted HD phosphohydrolase